jgi:hypothetical protein
MKIEESIRFAEISLKNGKSKVAEQREATIKAQEAEITNFDYLKARLLLGVTNGDVNMVKQWLRE